MAEQFEIEDFDTAKAVFEKLKDLPAERRRRILGWVAEGLGVALQSIPAMAPPIPTAPSSPAARLPQATATDIKTFVAAKAPKSDVQFAATVAYYYRFEVLPASRLQTINGDTLQEAARLAARTRLANPRATLNNAKALGYLDLATPGEFSINSVGENLVAMTLPGNSESGTKAKKTKKKGRKG
ncbi:MAG TPA: hypothetical protein VMT67_03735 [Terriglobales bacterium]|nr:hypothetical protein [Terriglobales bacterium]